MHIQCACVCLCVCVFILCPRFSTITTDTIVKVSVNLSRISKHNFCADERMRKSFPSAYTRHYKALTCGLRLGPKAMLVLEGPVMEGWPMGELMTGKGDARPLMGEWSWPGVEPMEDGVSRDGWSGWGPTAQCPVGELRGDECSWPDVSGGKRGRDWKTFIKNKRSNCGTAHMKYCRSVDSFLWKMYMVL